MEWKAYRRWISMKLIKMKSYSYILIRLFVWKDWNVCIVTLYFDWYGKISIKETIFWLPQLFSHAVSFIYFIHYFSFSILLYDIFIGSFLFGNNVNSVSIGISTEITVKESFGCDMCQTDRDVEQFIDGTKNLCVFF